MYVWVDVYMYVFMYLPMYLSLSLYIYVSTIFFLKKTGSHVTHEPLFVDKHVVMNENVPCSPIMFGYLVPSWLWGGTGYMEPWWSASLGWALRAPTFPSLLPACGSRHQLSGPWSSLPPRTLPSRALIRDKMAQVPPPCVLAKTIQV